MPVNPCCVIGLSATLTAVCSPIPALLAGLFFIAVSTSLDAVPGTPLVAELPGRPIADPILPVIGRLVKGLSPTAELCLENGRS